ncbi:MAG: hypothetical protein ACI8WB_005032 [Phenylobacterium sp.]|jgi:hypothetical protein
MNIEQLLYEEESTSLDFKKEPYKFSGVNDFQKSELLKDILAFANAWRRNTAYILLGVEEVKGGRSNPIGIVDELDDAQLQEFVNKKTQRPITFTYRNHSIDEFKIGVIEIPAQRRPIYLTKDYGKLKRNAVYIRRGSSTDEAPPDEVMQMAQAEIESKVELPNLKLEFADIKNEIVIGNEVTIAPVILDMSRYNEIADFDDPKSSHQHLSGGYIPENLFKGHARTDYYKELALYEFVHKKTKQVSFGITNPSQVSIKDATVNITIDKNNDKFSIFNPKKLPVPPKSHDQSILYPPPPELNAGIADRFIKRDNTFKLEEFDEFYRVKLTFRKVRPKQTIFCENAICVGTLDSFSFEVKVIVFADNLPEPIQSKLLITCNAKHETILFKGLDAIL